MAGAGLPSPPSIASITLFEPNTFFLLAAGSQSERRVLKEEGGAWCDQAEHFWLEKVDQLPSGELCHELNRFIHHFWNFDDWDKVPEKRLQWFSPDRMTSENIRRLQLEVLSILNTWGDPDEEVAHEMLRNLSRIPSKKIILSPLPGPGSRNLLRALASLLSRFLLKMDVRFDINTDCKYSGIANMWLSFNGFLFTERLDSLWRRLLQEDTLASSPTRETYFLNFSNNKDFVETFLCRSNCGE